MKRLALLPIIALTAACSDSGILQPAPAAPEVVATASVPVTPANGGVVVRYVATFTGPIDPGRIRITPGGSMHIDGSCNGFDVTGDLEGGMYWCGKVNLNLDKVQGPAIGQEVVVEPTLMFGRPVSGGFVCRTNGLSRNYPGPDFTYYGDVFACNGFGDFEGTHMKGTFQNRTGTDVYDNVVVMW